MTRQMKLIGFLQAQNCSNYPASWRHPQSKPNWYSREYYEDIGRTLERASTVQTVINGRTVQQIRLGPGVYNLSDFPFAQGANGRDTGCALPMRARSAQFLSVAHRHPPALPISDHRRLRCAASRIRTAFRFQA